MSDGVMSWARLIDAGLGHVDRLDVDADGGRYRWIVRAADGSMLVEVWELAAGGYSVVGWRPGRRPAGGTSAMHEWVRDWSRTYYAHEVGELVVDLATLAG